MADPSITPGPLGPCEPYCSLADVTDCAVFTGTDEEAADAIIDASEILYVLLGRAITGTCTATVQTDRTCSFWSGDRLGYGSMFGLWGRRVDRDGIVLQAPVQGISEVAVDGIVLDDALYELIDGHLLVTVDRTSWSGVVTISYTFGAPIPKYVRDAAVELAIELWKDKCGGRSCLPANATSVARQGVSVQMDRNVDRVREAGPNLQKVAVAMSILNPTNERSQSEVWSPDDPHPTHSAQSFPVGP